MCSLFRIEMLPAHEGDCLWIEYGDQSNPSRLLIDSGTPGTFAALKAKFSHLAPDKRHIELMIVSHVDRDHIGGMLKLLDAHLPGLSFGDVWFNGWRHLADLEGFGPVDGETLSTWLDDSSQPWNQHFAGKAVVIHDVAQLPVKKLPGGMKLTLLSPGDEQLGALLPKWEEACRDAGIHPSKPPPALPPPLPGFETLGPLNVDALAQEPFESDKTEANGSSIAVLAEFDGRQALLAGDAFSAVLLDSIACVAASAGKNRLKLDVAKLPHHGSRANVSRDLLEKLECPRYLFSTNGARYQHPDREAVARTIRFGGDDAELIFNYRTEFNSVWDSPSLMKKYKYRATFPATSKEGQTVEL